MKTRPTLYELIPTEIGHRTAEETLEAMPMEDIMLVLSDTFQIKAINVVSEATVTNSVFLFGVTVELEYPECYADAELKPIESYERSASSMTSAKKALINIALKMWGWPTMFAPYLRTADAFRVYPYTKENHGQDKYWGRRCQRCGTPMDGSRKVSDDQFAKWLCHNPSCPHHTAPE